MDKGQVHIVRHWNAALQDALRDLEIYLADAPTPTRAREVRRAMLWLVDYAPRHGALVRPHVNIVRALIKALDDGAAPNALRRSAAMLRMLSLRLGRALDSIETALHNNKNPNALRAHHNQTPTPPTSGFERRHT